jgi:hypothetical protein
MIWLTGLPPGKLPLVLPIPGQQHVRQLLHHLFLHESTSFFYYFITAVKKKPALLLFFLTFSGSAGILCLFNNLE